MARERRRSDRAVPALVLGLGMVLAWGTAAGAADGETSFGSWLAYELPRDLTELYRQPAELDPAATLGLAAATALAVRYDAETFAGLTPVPGSAAALLGKVGTFLGEPGVMSLAIAVTTRGDPALQRSAVRAVAFAGLNTQVLKVVLGQARPRAGVGPVFQGPSLQSAYHALPSGHTTAAFALATVLADRYPRHRWLYYMAALLVGYSRVADDQHWPSNVLAGAAVGYASARHALAHSGPGLSWDF